MLALVSCETPAAGTQERRYARGRRRGRGVVEWGGERYIVVVCDVLVSDFMSVADAVGARFFSLSVLDSIF